MAHLREHSDDPGDELLRAGGSLIIHELEDKGGVKDRRAFHCRAAGDDVLLRLVRGR